MLVTPSQATLMHLIVFSAVLGVAFNSLQTLL